MGVDYSPFLNVLPDGTIWWPLGTAVKLGAGFLPLRDDSQNLVPTLQARNNRVRAGERTLLGEFSQDHYTDAHPRILQRDDGRSVEAHEFLAWLKQYVTARSSAPFPFPDALAEAVRLATEKASVNSATSADFDSLTLALEDFFDTRLEDLPDALRQRVRKEFFPMPWADLSGARRREVARQIDYQHDPSTEDERQHWWDFFGRMREVERQIADWEAAATPTASDLALREARLIELRRQLAQIKTHKRQERGDYQPSRPMDKSTAPPSGETVRYIPYPKAMAQLEARLGATVEELAAWTWLGGGSNRGGLTAYMNANELDPPPRFHFATGNENADYIAPLMACWFVSTEIEQFVPSERFMTGQKLIERWSGRPHLNATAFIQAKIAESRLSDIHPIYGGTTGTFSEEKDFPALLTGLFALSEVKKIEDEDFGEQVGQQAQSKVGSPEWRRLNAAKAANAKHDKPGGARDKKRQLLEIWASGKYTTRDRCAEEECSALGMSFAAARKALTNAPLPSRC